MLAKPPRRDGSDGAQQHQLSSAQTANFAVPRLWNALSQFCAKPFHGTFQPFQETKNSRLCCQFKPFHWNAGTPKDLPPRWSYWGRSFQLLPYRERSHCFEARPKFQNLAAATIRGCRTSVCSFGGAIARHCRAHGFAQMAATIFGHLGTQMGTSVGSNQIRPSKYGRFRSSRHRSAKSVLRRSPRVYARGSLLSLEVSRARGWSHPPDRQRFSAGIPGAGYCPACTNRPQKTGVDRCRQGNSAARRLFDMPAPYSGALVIDFALTDAVSTILAASVS